jgi:tRNA(fMet)-specific endonuclease VapC
MNKLIAAHALALGITLVTNKIADFARYPGLLLENWVGTTEQEIRDTH